MALFYWRPGLSLSALYLLYTVGGITQSPLFIRLRGIFIPLYLYTFIPLFLLFYYLSVFIPEKLNICIYRGIHGKGIKQPEPQARQGFCFIPGKV